MMNRHPHTQENARRLRQWMAAFEKHRRDALDEHFAGADEWGEFLAFQGQPAILPAGTTNVYAAIAAAGRDA